MRNKLIDDTKKYIKRILRESGFIQDQESRTALEDNEATGYLDLEGSGNEESQVEDDNSDPEADEAVEELEEVWNQDEWRPIWDECILIQCI